jgi:tetratricopeptide (TPR) repeat protein
MRILFLLILGLGWISICGVKAQNQVRIDSLLNELQTAQDKKKVDVLNGLGFEFRTFEAERTLKYATEAVALSQKLNYGEGLSTANHNMGSAYILKQDYSKALKSLLLALTGEEKQKDQRGIAQCLNDIGDVYKAREEYKQALGKYTRAVEIFEELEYKEGTAVVLGNIAAVYFKLERYKDALEFAEKSLSIAQESGADAGTNETAKESCKILSEAHFHLKNFEEAYTYQQLYVGIKDSLAKRERVREIVLVEQKFEREMAKIRKEKEEQEAKKAQMQRDNMQYSLIGLIFIVLFGGIFFIGRFDIPPAYIETLIFASCLLLFRFLIMVLMPFADTYGEGSPIVNLGVNFGLALLFLPLHRFLELRLKKKIIEENVDEDKIKVKEKTNKTKEKTASDK